MIRRGVNGTEGDFAAAFDDVGEAAGRGIENKSDNNGVRSEMSWGPVNARAAKPDSSKERFACGKRYARRRRLSCYSTLRR